MTDLDERMEAILALAPVEPVLAYVQRTRLPRGAAAADTVQAIADYFATQPEAYRRELEAFHALNRTGDAGRCFVFTVCYNELANLPRIVELYASQRDLAELQAVFLVNYTVRDDPRKNALDEQAFRESVRLLLELKRRHDFIHVVAKRFSAHIGGLARARKYAMDYALFACARSRDPGAAVLVCNEGDTLHIADDYARRYMDRIGAGAELFIQGRVAYPEEVSEAPLLQLYGEVRERVHIGQGLHDRRYPGYEGIMPIGRNYGVHPKVACLAGGIDPVPLKSAEDDLTFGFDIYHLLGKQVKHYAEDVILTTHPRREILIVRGLLSGRPDDAKSMYENFHDDGQIYDLAWGDYMRALDEIGRFSDSSAHRSLVVNQFYQWVMRTVLKNYFWLDRETRTAFARNRRHRIGYWEREALLWDIYRRSLAALPAPERKRFLTLVVEESLGWFNDLIAGVARFEQASVALDSRLVR